VSMVIKTAALQHYSPVNTGARAALEFERTGSFPRHPGPANMAKVRRKRAILKFKKEHSSSVFAKFSDPGLRKSIPSSPLFLAPPQTVFLVVP